MAEPSWAAVLAPLLALPLIGAGLWWLSRTGAKDEPSQGSDGGSAPCLPSVLVWGGSALVGPVVSSLMLGGAGSLVWAVPLVGIGLLVTGLGLVLLRRGRSGRDGPVS